MGHTSHTQREPRDRRHRRSVRESNFCEMPGGNFGNQSTLNCGSTRPRNRSRRLCKRRPACPATHINAGGLKVAALILIINDTWHRAA